MGSMRFTIVQAGGGISFAQDEFMLPALVAACAFNPTTYDQLLDALHEYDRRARDDVRLALSVFDEHNVPGAYDAIHRWLDETASYRPAFRIVDERTRQVSLQPYDGGLVIFNLKERRIVQVHNTVGDVVREGAVRHHNGQQWTQRVHPYALPESWRILP